MDHETQAAELNNSDLSRVEVKFFGEWLKRMWGGYGCRFQPGVESLNANYSGSLGDLVHSFMQAEYSHLDAKRLSDVKERVGYDAEIRSLNVDNINGLSGGRKRQQMFRDMWDLETGNVAPDLTVPQGVLHYTKERYSMIDGNHRFMRLQELGVKEALWVVFV